MVMLSILRIKQRRSISRATTNQSQLNYYHTRDASSLLDAQNALHDGLDLSIAKLLAYPQTQRSPGQLAGASLRLKE